ncbi:hypothetical protein ABIC03_003444 [Bradyrhizobium sp. RT6a]|uniref:DUF6074 family protein n=1 Tax=unclassified Bradyrhizobium TaxID=2631580 RepID=UPI003390AFC1
MSERSQAVTTARIVPFPYIHRRAFIERQAMRAAELNADAGERHVRHQVQIQVDAMRRKGIGEELILREARCMETAIRTALWRTVMDAPGGSR